MDERRRGKILKLLRSCCRDVKRREKLEKDVRELKSSLDARQVELRNRTAEVQMGREPVQGLRAANQGPPCMSPPPPPLFPPACSQSWIP